MNGVWIQRWTVEGSRDNVYTVALNAQGEYGCSCPAWTKHSPRKDCKHILQIKLNKAKEENEQLSAVVKIAAKQAPTGVFGEPQFDRKSNKPIKDRITRKFNFED